MLKFADAYPLFERPHFRFTASDAKQLMKAFVLASKDSHIKKPLHTLVTFIRLALQRFLSGECRTLDQAFRLVKAKPGGRHPDPSVLRRRLELARAVVTRMQAGDGRDVAIDAVSVDHRRTFEYVRDAYQDLKLIVRTNMKSE